MRGLNLRSIAWPFDRLMPTVLWNGSLNPLGRCSAVKLLFVFKFVLGDMLFHKALLTTKVLQSSSSSLESRESVHAAIYFFNTLISAVCLRLNLRNAFLVFRVGVMGALVACVLAPFSYIPLLFYFSLFLLFPRQSTSAHIS